jgi:putative membrane protein
MWDSIIDVVSPHLLAGSVMAAVMGVMLIVHWVRGGKHKASDALEILKQRYAKGEIDRNEFEERRKVLGG